MARKLSRTGLSGVRRSVLPRLTSPWRRPRGPMARSASSEAVEVPAAVSIASHELRAPLTAVLGYAELLLEREMDETERRRHLTTIVQSGRHMLSLINDLLDVAKLAHTGDSGSAGGAFDVREALGEVESLLGVLAEAKSIGFVVRADGRVPKRVVGDELRFRQVLINLATNAIKFTNAGEVWVGVRFEQTGPERGVMRCAVRDTGVGLSPEDLDRVFELFTQAGKSVTDGAIAGSGLGLTISRYLAQAMGGRIEASSRLGEGSTFTAVVPMGFEASGGWFDGAVSEAGASGGVPRAERSVAGALSGVRVVVADDCRDSRRLATLAVERAGAEVVLARDGLEAIERVVEGDGRGGGLVVLMDMQMPGMDGLEASRRLRRAYDRLGIIALTANASPIDRRSALHAGCDAYVVKPFRPKQLVEVCAQVLSRQARRAA